MESDEEEEDDLEAQQHMEEDRIVAEIGALAGGQFSETPYQRYGHTVVAYNEKAYLWGGQNYEHGSSHILHKYDPGESFLVMPTINDK